MADQYSAGHHASVLKSHRWRTATNSAAYLLPHLTPGTTVLDVGCGPGTITADFARSVAPGHVLGIDAAASVIEQATTDTASLGLSNLDFAVGNSYQLDYADASFDVVHTHQVLHHVSDPVAMLRAMRRVAKPHGVVAAREVDYEGFVLAPRMQELEEWLALYLRVHRGISGEPSAGRHLKEWSRLAGFSHVQCSASVWLFEDDEDRRWWGGMWAERTLKSSFAENAQRLGLADRAALTRIAEGWQRWAEDPNGWLLIPHAEILATP